MSKLQKYNQIIFAIIGTTVVFGIMITILLKPFSYMTKKNKEDGLLTTQEQAKLTNDNKRIQKVNFGYPNLIDEKKQLFIVPVTHNDLDEAELINSYSSTQLGAYNMLGSGYNKGSNNLVLFNKKEKSAKLLFNERFYISDYSYQDIVTKSLLLVSGTNQDSNKDKKLNKQDLQQLFILDLISGDKVGVSLAKSQTFLGVIKAIKNDIESDNVDKELIVKIGLDEDEDGLFEPNYEKVEYMTLNLETMALESVVPDAVQQMLQKILDNG